MAADQRLGGDKRKCNDTYVKRGEALDTLLATVESSVVVLNKGACNGIRVTGHVLYEI